MNHSKSNSITNLSLHNMDPQIIFYIPGIVYWTNNDSILLGCNTNFAKMLGLSSCDEIVGISAEKLAKLSGWTQSALKNFKCHNQEIVKTGIDKSSIEESFTDVDGNKSYFLTNRAPIYNNKKEIIGVINAAIDITQRKEMEREAIESKANLVFLSNLSKKITGESDHGRYQNAEEYVRAILHYLDSIIACMPGNVYWTDKNSVYLGCNENTARYFGLKSRAEIIGVTYEDMARLGEWYEGQEQSFRRDDQEVMCTGKPKLNVEEPPITDSQGNLTYFLTSRVPILNEENQVTGIVGISIDITDRKKMEEALKVAKEKAESANKAKTEFIANMSHDIRTPMTGVIGMAKILEGEGDSEKDREYGHVIHASSEQLLLLLNDILEVISVEETRKEHLKLETFSLKERIQHLHELMLPNIQSDHIKTTIKIDPNFPDYVIGDRIKLDRIVLNLVSNALKFTSEGEITIKVKLLSKKKNALNIEVLVSDTGIGINQDQLEKIFERFYRVNPSYENRYSGHGIGLFIVQKYVSLLGGTISVESTLGKGTTFKLNMPMKIGKKEDREVVSENNIIPELDSLALKLTKVYRPLKRDKLTDKYLRETEIKGLLIEDDMVARRVAKKMLQAVGFDIDDVETAEEGFKRLLEKSYDVIVTDIGLPGLSGDQFTELTRSWEKMTHHSHIPIVGLTAHGKQQEIAAKSAGMDEVFTKPIDESKVKRIIERFFSKRTEIVERKLVKEKIKKKKQSKLGLELPDTEKELFRLEIYPIFDEIDGVEKAAGSRELLIEILTLLVQETIPEEKENLNKAHAIEDWQATQAIAHKLKGGALYCGTIRMRYACQYMERYHLAGHNKLLEKLYQQMLVVLGETQASVSNWLKQQQ